MNTLLGLLILLTSIFLILVVLVQRGRGGGLTGALGGMGGQSAFGTKAGDTFTRVTIGVAAFWILLCIGTTMFISSGSGLFGDAPSDEGVSASDGSADNTGDASSESEGSGSPAGGQDSSK